MSQKHTEPEIDSQRVLTDQHYKYEKVGEALSYMNSIEPYEDRVYYYIKACEALGEECRFGSMPIFKESDKEYGGEPRLRRYENGEPVPHHFWALKESTDEESRIKRRILFHERRRKVSGWKNWKNESLADRITRFIEQSNNWNPVELAKTHLEVIKTDIERFHREHTEAMRDRHTPGRLLELKRQRLQAPALIESELLGNRAIDWLTFIDSTDKESMPFVILWDMVAYKLFLIQQIGKPNNTMGKSDRPENPDDSKRLEDWFEYTSKYATVMNLLVEKGWCQAGTYIWIDESGGAKATVVAFIKYLHAQGFYRNNKKPSNAQIVVLAKNTFGVDLSIDTAKRTSAPRSPSHNLTFIGPASTH